MKTLTSDCLTDSLHCRAEDLTVRNSREGATVTPPLIAAQSPLHELLIAEIAASIPVEVSQKLRASRAVAQAHDWIAAGAMYTWIKSQPDIARSFLRELGDRPHEASLALARTFARTLDPPPPEPRVWTLDRAGLVIEGLAAVLLLVVRGAVFACLSRFASPDKSSFPITGINEVLANCLCPELFWMSPPPGSLRASLALASVSAWLFAEAVWAPRCLRRCRALPLIEPLVRVRANWPPDSTAVFWAAHAIFLQLMCAVMAIHRGLQTWQSLWATPAGRMVICVSGLVLLCQATAMIAWVCRKNPGVD